MELFKSVVHPSELWALVKFKYGGGKDMIMPKLDYVSELNLKITCINYIYIK